jgi:hypothetical protein
MTGESTLCPIRLVPISSPFNTSSTFTDKTASAVSVSKFLDRFRLKTISSQLPMPPHFRPAFSTAILASSAEAHFVFEILMTTSRKPASFRRCQEASPLQPLTSCRQGCIWLLIHSLPSRRRSLTSPRVRSRPLLVLVRSARSVCTWSLSLSCRRSCSGSQSIPPADSNS